MYLVIVWGREVSLEVSVLVLMGFRIDVLELIALNVLGILRVKLGVTLVDGLVECRSFADLHDCFTGCLLVL